MGSVGQALGLYVGMPTSLMGSVVPGLGLYVGNLKCGRSPGCLKIGPGL